MTDPTSHERWLRLVAERLHKQQRDYDIANTCEESADAIASLRAERDRYLVALNDIASGAACLPGYGIAEAAEIARAAITPPN